MTDDRSPSPVVRAYGGATVGFECPACQRIVTIPPQGATYLDGEQPHDFAQRAAAKCCGPWHCEKHDLTLTRGSWCPQCAGEKDALREQATFEKASKILLADYTGEYLFRDGFGREGFFPADEIEDMRDHGKAPDWAYACELRPVTRGECDLQDHVAEGILADHHEDAFDWVDRDKLEAASKLVFESCADVKTYDTETSTVVLITSDPQ